MARKKGSMVLLWKKRNLICSYLFWLLNIISTRNLFISHSLQSVRIVGSAEFTKIPTPTHPYESTVSAASYRIRQVGVSWQADWIEMSPWVLSFISACLPGCTKGQGDNGINDMGQGERIRCRTWLYLGMPADERSNRQAHDIDRHAESSTRCKQTSKQTCYNT